MHIDILLFISILIKRKEMKLVILFENNFSF